MRHPHAPWIWISADVLIRMISAVPPDRDKRARNWAKKMESSRRFILQAEIEYWHEMLHLNRNVLSHKKEDEMRLFLKQALRDLNGNQYRELQAAA